MDPYNRLQWTCKMKESKKKQRGKENFFANGTFVIKFQAKSAVYYALSFTSILNMHEFILHEQAQCLHWRHQTQFAWKKQKRQYIQIVMTWTLRNAYQWFFIHILNFLSFTIISNHKYKANFFRAAASFSHVHVLYKISSVTFGCYKERSQPT